MLEVETQPYSKSVYPLERLLEAGVEFLWAGGGVFVLRRIDGLGWCWMDVRDLEFALRKTSSVAFSRYAPACAGTEKTSRPWDCRRAPSHIRVRWQKFLRCDPAVVPRPSLARRPLIC